MNLKLKEICKLINGTLYGNENILIVSVNQPEFANNGDICFINDDKNVEKLKTTKASAAIVPRFFEEVNIAQVVVENPYLAFIKILNIIYSEKNFFYKGIHPTAIIGANVKLGKNISIGPYCVICDNVIIEDATVLVANIYIGYNVKIGKNTFLYPNVTVYHEVEIGNNVIIHSGTVIGSDGFGYVQSEGKHIKIPQVGKVVIEDDVEIGANVTIDRATLTETRIKRGSKIDNLVHIAHNVEIGENVLLLAQVGIAGSSKIGDNTILAGQTGVTDHINVGKNVKAGPRTGIVQNVDDDQVVWGTPPIPFSEQKKIAIASRKLPKLLKEFIELKQEIDKIKEILSKLTKEKN